MLRTIRFALVLATAAMLAVTTAHLQAVPNISVMSLPYTSWQAETRIA